MTGRGGGDCVENAQNRFGDFGGRSLGIGGGGGDLGRRGGSAVSDPNDDVESRGFEEAGGCGLCMACNVELLS